jgi:hypothetical protein
MFTTQISINLIFYLTCIHRSSQHHVVIIISIIIVVVVIATILLLWNGNGVIGHQKASFWFHK